MLKIDRLPRITPGTEWSPIEFISEPFVTVTFRGYSAACDVRSIETGLAYTLLLGAKSLSDSIEPLRTSRGGELIGLKVAIRKASEERTAPYELRLIQ